MTDIRPVYPDMFEEVHGSLLVRLDSRRPKEEWRRLFDPGWARPEEHVGKALYDGDRMVAFLGMLFAECVSGGRSQRLCNVHSWIAEDGYRRDAIALVLGLRGEGRYTVTNLSPEPHVRDIFLRLGFRVLEQEVLIMRPPLSPAGFMAPRGARTTWGAEAIAPLLDPEQSRLHEDHRPYARHVVIETRRGLCYALYHIRRRRRIRTALLHHMSEPAVFVDALPAVRAHLFKRHGALMIEADPRLLRGVTVPCSFRIRRRYPRLFKPAGPSGEGAPVVPNLYSELVLLNLE